MKKRLSTILCAALLFLATSAETCGGGVIGPQQLCTETGGSWNDSDCPPGWPPACGETLAPESGDCGRTAVCECPARAPYWIDGQGCVRAEVCRDASSYPAEVMLDQKMLSFGIRFEVAGVGGHSEGSIDEKVISWTRSFAIVDETGTVTATSKQNLFSWGLQVDVFDAHGAALGTIKEEVWQSFFSWKTHYTILGPTGQPLAESEELELFTTTIVMKKDGQTVAELYRPAFNPIFGGDNWQITFTRPDTLDARIVLLAAAYKTAHDTDRYEEQQRDDD